MRNIETRFTKSGPDDAGINQLLTDARMEERRARAAAMAVASIAWLAVLLPASLTMLRLRSCCVSQLKTSRKKRRRSSNG